MADLFEPSEINGMTLSNRFVRSATWDGLAMDDGSCKSRLMRRNSECLKFYPPPGPNTNCIGMFNFFHFNICC